MSNATLCLRAHFDGKFIVPDEPVVLPLHAPLDIEVRTSESGSPEISRIIASKRNPKSAALRLAHFSESSARVGQRALATAIPPEALRRENMYGDDGR